MPPKLPTKPSTPRLSEVARHLIIPDGIVSTGWPAVRDTCATFGVGFDPWQHGGGTLILGKRTDGLYAADQVVISIPRQVGKTYLIGWIVFALCLLNPGLTVLWTAHRFKTASETYSKLAAMSRRKKVAPHVDRAPRNANDQGIYFKNGSRIMFGARERGFGRGFDNVDIEVFDEAQILTENALDDMVPATNVAKNPLLIYIGTPPKPTDPGEVFTDFRERALTGESGDTLYIELSADRGCDPHDRVQWRKANASYPHRTDERAMLRMIKNLTRDSWPREGLGIWDETAHKPVLTKAAWAALQAHGDIPDVPAGAVGIDGTADGTLYACGAWRDVDETHLELLPLPADLNDAADLIARRCRRRIPVLIHSTSPAKPIVPLLVAKHVNVKLIAGPDMATATGLMVSDLKSGCISHVGQGQLTAAVLAGRLKPYGTAGAKVWDFTTDGIPPLIAATLARLGAATTRKPRTSRPKVGILS